MRKIMLLIGLIFTMNSNAETVESAGCKTEYFLLKKLLILQKLIISL